MTQFSSVEQTLEEDRHRAATRSTWISVIVNIGLTLAQIMAGIMAHSQGLIADGIHSLSDLIADFVVLFATKHSQHGPDERHPYGHARFENAASLVLALLLIVVGAGMLWSAGQKLQHPEALPKVEWIALWVALLALIAKEGLFRYMLAVAERVRSQMLVANAWHARSDAASSLVVAVGIAGNLAGYTFLDGVAALIVGFMVLKMGWEFGYEALSDLMDRGLSHEEVENIRLTLLETPGVQGIHELRTRKMGDFPIIDAHLLVLPNISVSEGHYIADTARRRVIQAHDALDVLVHIDPEDDKVSPLNPTLPSRETLLNQLAEEVPTLAHQADKAVLHYLEGKVEIDLFLEKTLETDKIEELMAIFNSIYQKYDFLKEVRLHKRIE